MQAGPQFETLKKIYWIASFPKSGNTWIRFLLDSYFHDGPPNLNERAGRFCYGDLRVSAYQPAIPWPLPSAPRYIWGAARGPAMLRLVADNAGEPLGIKTHHANVNMFGCPLIPEELSAAAIYLIRDPRDIAVSWSHHANVGMDRAIEMLVTPEMGISNQDNGLGHYTSAWREHVYSWTVQEHTYPTCVVKYEEMLENPANEFRAILAMMPFGDVDEERLQRAVEHCQFDKLQKREDEEGFREKKGGDHFFRQGKVGQWKERMTDGQLYRIEEACGDMMQRYGYTFKHENLKPYDAETEQFRATAT